MVDELTNANATVITPTPEGGIQVRQAGKGATKQTAQLLWSFLAGSTEDFRLRESQRIESSEQKSRQILRPGDSIERPVSGNEDSGPEESE
ncbi:hypothetical protein [Streptomyces sp. NBC_00435]|uniref:hypothetical protein n=1 Tax=Streptomyces sp. NBC_00435 TaxID=2903649 RepID=UPI003FA6D15B